MSVATLSPQALELIRYAPSKAWLAASALRWMAGARWDQTRWPGPIANGRLDHCIGGHIAMASGFRRGSDYHRTHTGDLWWDVLEGLMGDERLPCGLSIFAPEAQASNLGPALWAIVDANQDREVAAA